jgi:hypothetical protein
MSFFFVGNEEPVIVGGIGVDRNSPLKHIQNIPLFKAQITTDYQFIEKLNPKRQYTPHYLSNPDEFILYCRGGARSSSVFYLEMSIHLDYDSETKKQKEKMRDDLLNDVSKFFINMYKKDTHDKYDIFSCSYACRIIKYNYIEKEPLKITYLMMPGDMDGFIKSAFYSIPIYVNINYKGFCYNYNDKFVFRPEDKENYIYIRPPVWELNI